MSKLNHIDKILVLLDLITGKNQKKIIRYLGNHKSPKTARRISKDLEMQIVCVNKGLKSLIEKGIVIKKTGNQLFEYSLNYEIVKGTK